MQTKETQTFTIPSNEIMASILGQHDGLLKIVEAEFSGSDISFRGNELSVSGPDSNRVVELFSELVSLAKSGHKIDADNIKRSIDMVRDNIKPSAVLNEEISRSYRGRPVRPKTSGQKRYAQAIEASTITFAIGPAGTGKSYLAVAMAVKALRDRKVNRIILTRPAVEAGERLGFLPGDMMAKVDPYLRPLYDALHDLLEAEGLQKLLERGTIEVAPLAFMRGRTLNDSFVILDEAQNTTKEQMKMFLTRVGFGSTVVVTGDITQVDIPGGRSSSGLVDLEKILVDIDGISFVFLDKRDVVRHRIVAAIVDAYEKHSNSVSHILDSKRDSFSKINGSNL